MGPDNTKDYTIFHINEDTTIYRDAREPVFGSYFSEHVFGTEEIHDFDTEQAGVAHLNRLLNKYGGATLEEAKRNMLNDIRDLLDILAAKNDAAPFVEALWHEAMANRTIWEQIETTWNEYQESEPGEQLSPFFLTHSGIVTDRILEQILRNHETLFIEKAAEFETQIPQLRQKFEEDARTWLDKNHIPLTAEYIKNRLDGVSIRLVDGLVMTQEDIYGQYNPDLAEVLIAEQVPDDLLEHVFAHEMWHVLSGRTIIVQRTEDELGEDFIVEEQRIGMQIARTDQYIDSDEDDYALFRWLNEGMTEYITRLSKQESDVIFYLPQQHLLWLLIGGGKNGTEGDALRRRLRHDLFMAYFENYDPQFLEKNHATPVPAWKQMMSTLNSLYSLRGYQQKPFIQAINGYISNNGMSTTIRRLSQAGGWKDIVDVKRKRRKSSH